MTETEIKAAEMVREYYYAINGNKEQDFELTMKSNQFVSGGLYSINQAKQCALIACDNTIAQLSELIDPENVSFWHGNKAGETIGGIELQEYWQSVRAEIEKL
jgi:hypothetical protein